MTETVKKRKRPGCSTQVEENMTETAPPGDNLNKQLTVAKRKRYTFEGKKKILEECKTLNSRELCVKYGLNKSVLSKWRSNEETIKNAAKTSHTKTLKKFSETNELDVELFTWLSDCRSKGIPVSGPKLCRQALVINSRIGGPENFKASHGWLEKWKKRTHVKNLKITTRSCQVAAQRTMSNSTGIYSVAYVTVPNEEVAKKIARGLVGNKMAACVNIIPQITSIYEWKNEIQEDKELLLMIKTRTDVVDSLTKYVKENHPYEVCEVISLPIENGNQQYLDWIGGIVKSPKKE